MGVLRGDLIYLLTVYRNICCDYCVSVFRCNNQTKAGVDILDKLVRTYSCRRSTRRWTVALFFNIIDIAAVNALILWVTKHPDWNQDKLRKSNSVSIHVYNKCIFFLLLCFVIIITVLRRFVWLCGVYVYS